jgi:hypothetical protein
MAYSVRDSTTDGFFIDGVRITNLNDISTVRNAFAVSAKASKNYWDVVGTPSPNRTALIKDAEIAMEIASNNEDVAVARAKYNAQNGVTTPPPTSTAPPPKLSDITPEQAKQIIEQYGGLAQSGNFDNLFGSFSDAAKYGNTPPPQSPTDDNTPRSRATIEQQINESNKTSGAITPRPNILDQFASYTYNIAWYCLTVDQYRNMKSTSKVDVSQWSLLVQSGGAAQQQNGTTQQGVNFGQNTPINGPVTVLKTPNRNKYFTLDYYLDDLEIKSQVTGSNASQFSEITFKVSEPNGITLIPNLNYAIRELTDATPLAAQFCIVIKFYGWDIDGNLITDPTKNTGSNGASPSISNAAITRYYPFTIAKVDFKIDGKTIVYDIKGIPTRYITASSTSLGSIPSDFEFSGETVGQVLSSSGNSASVKAGPDGRESTNTSSPSAPTSSTVRESTVAFDPVNNVI